MSNVKEKNHGKIVQVMGPVVDVEFEKKYTVKASVWSWKWHSILATIPFAASCWVPVKDFARIWMSLLPEKEFRCR